MDLRAIYTANTSATMTNTLAPSRCSSFRALDAAREANERASLGERAFGSPRSTCRSSRPPRLPQRRTRLRLVDWPPTNRQDFVCCARLPFRGHITAQKRTHSASNLFQEEWTFGTIVLFVCELDGTIDMPLQSRLIASGFPMPFPIGCNDASVMSPHRRHCHPLKQRVEPSVSSNLVDTIRPSQRRQFIWHPFHESEQWLVPWHTNTATH